MLQGVACLSKSTFLIPFFFGDSDDDEIEFGKDKVEEFLENDAFSL